MKPSDYYQLFNEAFEASGLLSSIPREINILDDTDRAKPVQDALAEIGICIVGYFIEIPTLTNQRTSAINGLGTFIFTVAENPATHATWRASRPDEKGGISLSALQIVEALSVYFISCPSLRNCQITPPDLNNKGRPAIQRTTAEEGEVRFNLEIAVPVNYSTQDFDFMMS